MDFRNLKKQYEVIKDKVDSRLLETIKKGQYIGGNEVQELERLLSDYVGTKHCISCGNGTDALVLALRALGIGTGDVVFVPDFTFFASAESISSVGATPYFVDVNEDTFNIDPERLIEAINICKAEGKNIKAVMTVDLYGLPAEYNKIENICNNHGLKLIEDGAQGFSGMLNDKIACSFGNVATTSFFPAKPLGCYGDGGAVFTNSDELASMVRSLAVHGKGKDKYDNERIGYNSRLDTIQASILIEKFKQLIDFEIGEVDKKARVYNEGLKDIVKIPFIPDGYRSAWAQYTITLKNEDERNGLSKFLKEKGIPTMVYYPKTMSGQTAFKNVEYDKNKLKVSEKLTKTVLSLPFSPYITDEEQNEVINSIKDYFNGRK